MLLLGDSYYMRQCGAIIKTITRKYFLLCVGGHHPEVSHIVKLTRGC